MSALSSFGSIGDLTENESEFTPRQKEVAKGIDEISESKQGRRKSKKDRLEGRKLRAVKWNVEMLLKHIKLIVAHRQAHAEVSVSEQAVPKVLRMSSSSLGNQRKKCPLEEVKEIITLPEFVQATKELVHPEEIQIDGLVMAQLEDLVTRIEKFYQRDNVFHNFAHASRKYWLYLSIMSHRVSQTHVL